MSDAATALFNPPAKGNARSSGYAHATVHHAERKNLPAHARATEIGAAAEHIVVADLLLSGYRAFFAGAQLPYDVVLDVAGRLLRVSVKSCMRPRARPCRSKRPENYGPGRPNYFFNCARAVRYSSGRVLRDVYGPESVDILAFVATDIKVVAYIAMRPGLPSIWEIEPPGEFVPSTKRYGLKRPRRSRKVIDAFPLAKALMELSL